MRRLVVGDIHGNLQGLLSALENASYDLKNDQLFFVGDYIDRHPHSREVVDFILTLPNTVCIRGNHDQFMIDHLNQKVSKRILSGMWKNNGGLAALESYGLKIQRDIFGRAFTSGEIPQDHKQFYHSLVGYHITPDNIAIVHGGFDLELQDMSTEFVIWDRLMWKTALKHHPATQLKYPCFQRFKKIFIGHTNLLSFAGQKECLPLKMLNVWNTDTGAGYTGPLTVMDMDTEKYWQSS